MEQEPKLTRKEFAQKIKTKYPDYKDIDDNELTDKMLAKYPEYKTSIVEDSKKKTLLGRLLQSLLRLFKKTSTTVNQTTY